MLILSGAYLGYLPEHYAAQWVAEGRLRCLLPGELSYVAAFTMISRRGAAAPAIVRQFIDDLQAVLPRPRPAAVGGSPSSGLGKARGGINDLDVVSRPG